MKVRELLENKNENSGAAQKKIEDLFSDLSSYIEDSLTSHEIDMGIPQVRSNGVSFKDESGEFPHLALHGSFSLENYVDGDDLIPTAEGSLALDAPLDREVHKSLKRIISRFFVAQDIHLTWSQMTPWQHKDHMTDTAKFTLARFARVPRSQPTGQSKAGYDARGSFDSRPGEVARQNRVRTSAYSDSFGGDASNYRR